MKSKPLQRTWLPSALSGAFLLLSPFVIFIRFHAYPLFALEVIACFAILAIVGAALGLIMELAGQYSRVVIFAFLITLSVDIQVHQLDRTLVLVIAFIVSLVVLWFLRNNLARFGTFILAVLFISSFVVPCGRILLIDQGVTPLTPGKPELPIVLHIILDEHISVEGIPVEFDADGSRAEALRDFYIDNGFQVFGRAYSRYFNTWSSIPNFMNLDAPSFRFAYCAGKYGNFHLMKNRYFELMNKRGFQIHVYQSDYLDFCHEKTGTEVANCLTYETEALQPFADSPYSTSTKIKAILGVYSRLSQIMKFCRIPRVRVSTVTSMSLFDKIQSDVTRAKAGTMFFVHIMFPHHPYSYRSDCSLREDPLTWLNSFDYQFLPGNNNDAESRAERYPQYLEQIACTNLKLGELFTALKAGGKFQNMVIIINGDHGSRIVTTPPDARYVGNSYSREDYIGAFSTLFAVKWPGVQASYDRRMLPLDLLLASFIVQGNIPEGTDWAQPQNVFFQQGQPQMVPRDMPDFGRELRPYEAGR